MGGPPSLLLQISSSSMLSLTARCSKLFQMAGILCLLAFSIFALLAEDSAKTRWTGESGGFWDEDANWNGGVPSAGQTAAEFLNFEAGSKVVLKSGASANFLQFVIQRSTTECDLTIEGQNGAALEVACQEMEPGFRGVFVCANRDATGKFRVFIDSETRICKPLPKSRAIPSIFSAQDFVLSFRGNLRMESPVNFGGPEDSRIEILGDMAHNGLRFGSKGTIVIGGKGTTSTARGPVTFAGGTIILSRPQAIAGRTYKMDGGILELAADGAISNPGDLSVLGPETLETGGHSAQFGTLTFADSGTLRIVLGGNSAVSFADSAACSWVPSSKLIIENHVPGKTSVSFGTSAAGLSASQLAGVTVNGKAAVLDSKGILQPR